MDKLARIEQRKIVPIAAMISSGKSKLLNVLFNIDFLQCGAGIATQFVNILRYNPKIDSPRFYHLKLIQKDGDYLFFKDPNYEVKMGEKDIIKENKRINEELKKIKDNQGINYEDIFYITEVKDVEFIKDKEYLKTHDFCDIPGLSESEEHQNKPTLNEKKENIDFDAKIKLGEKYGAIYRPKKAGYFINKNNITKNKENKNEKTKIKKEENKKGKKNIEEKEDSVYYETEVKRNTYLFEIFSIIKNKIDGAIILLSIENYYFEENFSIITKLYKVVQKDIINCLVILNKIDKSSNPKEDIEKCKGLFMKKFPNCKTFNLSSNIFISLSVFQLQNELLMKKSYEHLIRYHFYNYLKIFRLHKNLNDMYDRTFIDHLRDILRKINGANKREIIEKIEVLNNNSEDITSFNKIIKKFVEGIKKEFDVDGIKLGIEGIEEDIDDFEEPGDDNNDINSIKALDILKIFYIYHKNSEYLPPLSEETKKLLDYFKITYIKKKIPKFDIDKLNSKTQLNKDIIKALKNFSKEVGNFKIDNMRIKDLVYEITKTIEYLKTYNVIFIPFLGASNAGKTTIINGIIGKNLLPNDLNECTKKGIIIRYSKDDEITLRKASFQSEQFLERMNYFFQAGSRPICSGEENVKEALKDINYYFNEKEEDSFYYIRTKIKLFDEIGLNDSLKEMIYLIDFPGYGTGNIFEKGIYKKVMSICNSFVFVLRNSVIKDNNTIKAIDLLFSESKAQKKELASKFIKSSLFILNNDISQATTPTDLENAKGEISSILNLKERKNINVCFFNAKYYLNYCTNRNHYSSVEQLIDSEYKNYEHNKSILYTNPGSIKLTMNSSFYEFFYNELKNKIGDFNANYKKVAKEQVINENISKQIDKKFEKIENENYSNFKKYENYIKKFTTFCLENTNQLKTLKESNINQFKEKFSLLINNYNKVMQNELKKKVGNIKVLFDMFFESDYDEKKKDSNEIKNFNSNIEKIKEELKNLVEKNKSKIEEFIKDYRENIKNSLEKKRGSIEEQLNEKNYNIILEEINNEMVSNLENFNKKIKEYLDKNEEESYEYFILAKRNLEDFAKEKSNYLKLENKLKEYISKSIGDIEKDLEKEIFEEIKNSCESCKNIYYKKGFKDWFYSLFSSKYYLEKIIDMMIDTFSEKINRIIETLLENTNVYIKELERNIEHCALSVTLEFSKEQLNIWNELKEHYKQTREIIIKIKDIN